MTWTRSRTVSSRFTPPYSERDWKFGQWTHAEFWFRRPPGRNPYGLYAAPPGRRLGLTMLERLKELVRHSAIYGLGSIVARVIAVLLLPLYTRYLSPSDYGLIETLVARTAFWYVFAASTGVLVAGVALAQPISWLLFGTRSHDGLVTAAFVGLWAAMNYEQMTSLFRVEQRSTASVAATLANA